jgi:hypothetical protein
MSRASSRSATARPPSSDRQYVDQPPGCGNKPHPIRCATCCCHVQRVSECRVPVNSKIHRARSHQPAASSSAYSAPSALGHSPETALPILLHDHADVGTATGWA